MGKEAVILVDFPPEVVLKYRTLIEEYVPSTPIRTNEANLEFTKNQSYHAVAILFFLSQLPATQGCAARGVDFHLQAPHELRGVASAAVRR
jgi:hypothetical protein